MVDANFDEKVYLRFSVLHRIFHLVVMISFTGLALTGMPLKYSSHKWSQCLMSLFGGFENASYFHRFFALVTFGYVLLHILWLCYYKIVLKGNFLGPHSMVPGKKDFQDLWQNIKYFLGKGSPPKFGRFSYWEKFDYLAVFWGVPVIGLSGLILWFPEFFSRFLPGEYINIAYVIHSDEALLAIGFIFGVHLFNAHFRPDVFPLETSIFTGKTTGEEMRRHHQLEWEQLMPSKSLTGNTTNEKVEKKIEETPSQDDQKPENELLEKPTT